MLHLCFHQARAVWCYCSHKLYLYQLILRSVLFYALTEYGALVNQMLLMISGDVESNPGPGECLYMYHTINTKLTQYLFSGVSEEAYPHGKALPQHFYYACATSAKYVIPSRAHPKYSKCTVTIVICVYMLMWSLCDLQCLTFMLPWSQKHFTVALLKSSLRSAILWNQRISHVREEPMQLYHRYRQSDHNRGQCERKGYTVSSSEQRVAIGRYAGEHGSSSNTVHRKMLFQAIVLHIIITNSISAPKKA